MTASSDKSFHFYKVFHHKINAVLEYEMAEKRLLDDWRRLSWKCLWKDVVVNREPSFSGKVSLSLRQLNFLHVE